MWEWVAENWFDLLSSVGIIGGLIFTAVTLHSETKTRRVANLLTMTQNHRELWKGFYRNVEMTRILDPAADPKSSPVNRGEEIYIITVIQHLAAVYRAMRYDLTIRPEGMGRDVGSFFSLPIPKWVWDKIKPFQDKDFVAFVDECLRAS